MPPQLLTGLPRPTRLVRALVVVGGSLLLVGSILLMAGCASMSTSSADARIAALQQLPAYNLAYPSADLLAHGATPPTQSIDGSTGAVVTKAFGMHTPVPQDTTPQVIVSWYARQLQSQGWQLATFGNQSQYQVQQQWTTSKEYCHVGIYYPNTVKEYLPSVDPDVYPIVFEVDIGELSS